MNNDQRPLVTQFALKLKLFGIDTSVGAEPAEVMLTQEGEQ